jgi:membrane protease YdiL (CAAX protease family)
MGRSTSDSGAGWPPTFRAGWWPALAFVLAFAGWVVVSNAAVGWLFGDPSLVEEAAWALPSAAVQLGIVVAVLRYEGVGHRDLGLERRLVAPALVSTGAVVVVVNVAVAGLGMAAGTGVSFGVMAYYLTPPFDYPVDGLVARAATLYLLTGPIEELAFRGYLQNKVTAGVDAGSARVRTTVGIVAAALSFALLHVPVYLLVRGEGLGALVGTLALLTATGLLYGAMYAATRNLYLVMFLHAIGNLWPLVVDPGAPVWPNYGVILVVYVLLAVVYRRYTTDGGAATPGRPVSN